MARLHFKFFTLYEKKQWAKAMRKNNVLEYKMR